MKKTFLIAMLVSLVLVVLPAIAGDGHAKNAEYEKKCGADAQACLDWFANNYKGRGWAGVSLEVVDDSLRVSEVHYGTPAAKAGVKTGDVLVAINGVDYNNKENKEEMGRLEKLMVPGQEFTYTIARNGKNRDISFSLDEMPMDVVARMVGMHMLSDHAAVEVASADD